MEIVPHFDDTVLCSDESYEKNMEGQTCVEKDKKRCDFPKHCDCPKPKPCDDTKDIIESIALTESALAQILGAEGEKLQKAVKLACTIDDLMKINKSVQSTLIHATFLEQTLFAKLETVCNGCKKEM